MRFNKGTSQQRNRNDNKETEILELKYMSSKIKKNIHEMNLIAKWT